MTKIYIVRHGQDQDNANGLLNGHRDTALTEIGLEQANQITNKIQEANLVFDKIYSSPLQRAYRTAEIIANRLQLPKPEKLDLLIERDYGIMSGQKVADIEKLCSPNILKTNTVTYFLEAEGAETFPQVQDRAKQVLEFLTHNHTDQNILLVTHGDLGKMLYAEYYNLYWREVLESFHFGNSELLLLAPDSLAENTHIFNIEQYNH
jgi:broad specificity phosphatase PhoE